MCRLPQMFTDFFSIDDRLKRSGCFYCFLPADCGNDTHKAEELNSLIKKTTVNNCLVDSKQKHNNLLLRMFAVPPATDVPSSGPILSLWQEAVHKTFLRNASADTAGSS